NTGYIPRHAKTYANLSKTIIDAVTQYRDEVRDGTFPGKEQAF
ncbi:MAG: 3-methyl-2-oxobutanoate hydroxymethyltransferase, partial [Pirellulales bacterium]|nr:3-methyl-2-oxobutanoate hydroxymethyltransferase [Pirellulales bacterium]